MRFRTTALVGLVVALTACSSGNSPAAGSTGGAGGSGEGGSGGSPPGVDQGQVVAAPKAPVCTSLVDFTVLDNQYAYYTCQQDPPASSARQWTFYRASIPNGTPKALVTADKPLIVMTKDDGAYYLWKYEQYNPADGSSGSPDVKRLAFGSMTLQDFAPNDNPIIDSRLVDQTQTEMFLIRGSPVAADVFSAPKPGGGMHPVVSGIREPVDDIWLTGDQLAWVSGITTTGAPALAFEVPQAGGGTPQKLLDFPVLCGPALHHPASSGFWAFCRQSAQSKLYDIVQLSASGAQKVITKGVSLSLYFQPVVVGSKLYWVDNIVGAWSLRSVDDSGVTTTLLLPEDSLIQRILDGYVYFTPTSGDVLKRAALADAKTP